MDRQSEAYRMMTEEDIQEELPDSIHHPPCQSLDEVRLPQDNPQEEGYDKPKSLAQAEGRLFERIMDPTAPDDNSQQGVYTRMLHRQLGDAE
jgi:hypothetical protein